MQNNRITIICGHYGSGKTNYSLNLAVMKAAEGKSVTLVDMDIVNPYFRSSEYGTLLSGKGIRLIAPVYAGTTLDTPTIPPDVYSIFTPSGTEVIIDAGGDDAGVTALAGMSARLNEEPYEMLYVINRNRVLSQTPEEAVRFLREIEHASRLRATAVVNNSHLGVDTTLDTALSSLGFAEKTAEFCGLPLLCSTVPDFAVPKGTVLPGGFMKIERMVLFPWEREEENEE